MPAEVIEKWLKSGRYAQVNGTRLRPIEHNILKGTPLSIQRGQAEAFCLTCDKGENYILKKFHREEAWITTTSYLQVHFCQKTRVF